MAFWLGGAGYGTNAAEVFPTDTWSHVAGTWNGTLMRLYMNGNPVSTASFAELEPAWTGRVMQIGAMNSGECFLGKIDDVRIYDEALTDAQIQELYAGE